MEVALRGRTPGDKEQAWRDQTQGQDFKKRKFASSHRLHHFQGHWGGTYGRRQGPPWMSGQFMAGPHRSICRLGTLIEGTFAVL